MSALYVRSDESFLCQALCQCWKSLGQSLNKELVPGARVLWFPRRGEDLSEALLPLMEKQTEGSVLVMLPYRLWEGDPLRVKDSEWAGGVCAAVRALALRFAPGWRINCLRYGHTEDEKFGPREAERVALGRPACWEELARAALFFVGEGSSFMTGQSIDVNGGRLN